VRTIAIINQKGGCGKTTVSINLAAVLAERGHRTLLVDMDPQSHCGLGLAVPETQVHQSTADLLLHGLDGTIGLSEITWQIARNFDLAPASMALAAAEQRLSAAPDKDRRLQHVLSTVASRYDYCIIDCPPAIGLLTFNALRAAREVIVPVETGYFALQGSVRQEKTIELLARRVGHEVRLSVLPTMYDVRTKLAREILGELKRHFGDKMLPMVVNFNAKLKEAASFGQPITEYDAASRGMQDFEQLASWLLANPPAIASAPAANAKQARQTPGLDTPHPTISRAAELVERARALASRSADLSDRMDARDAAPRAPLPPPPPPATPSPQPSPQRSPHPERVPRSAEAATAIATQAEQDEEAETATITAPALAASQSPVAITIDATPPPPPDPKIERLYGVRQTAKGVLFAQPDRDAAGQVAVAGDFNGWNPSRTPLQRDENLGLLQAMVRMPPGRYRYRLVVDGDWVQDPHNPKTEANPYGDLNSIVEVA